MGHGNRWEAVGGGDAQSVLAHTVPRIIQFGTAIAGSERRIIWPGGDHGQEEAVVTTPVGLVLRDDPFILCAITLARPKVEGSIFMTAYPTPGEGITRRLIVRDLEEDCLGLEGWIHAETELEVPISFFATDYFAKPDRYAKGAVVDVSLSGLAYAVEAATPREIMIDDPETVRRYRETGMESREGELLRISTQGAAVLLPMANWDPFDYRFQGPLKRHSRILHETHPFRCLSVTVARSGDDDIDLPVLAGDHVLGSEIPDLGEDVAGSMCIMGRLADGPFVEIRPALANGEDNGQRRQRDR